MGSRKSIINFTYGDSEGKTTRLVSSNERIKARGFLFSLIFTPVVDVLSRMLTRGTERAIM